MISSSYPNMQEEVGRELYVCSFNIKQIYGIVCLNEEY